MVHEFPSHLQIINAVWKGYDSLHRKGKVFAYLRVEHVLIPLRDDTLDSLAMFSNFGKKILQAKKENNRQVNI